MNARTGKLSKRDMDTLNKAWGILSKWAEWAEKDTDTDLMTDNQDYLYTHACYAVTGLCEFINNYEG